MILAILACFPLYLFPLSLILCQFHISSTCLYGAGARANLLVSLLLLSKALLRGSAGGFLAGIGLFLAGRSTANGHLLC